MSSAAILAPDTPRRPRARPARPDAGAARRGPSSEADAAARAAAVARATAQQEQQSRDSGLLRARPGRKAEQAQQRRDENMAVILDDIAVGPYAFPAPPRDPSFQGLEPYSGIRLRSRTLPFDDFQHLMIGRRYVSVSMLYTMVHNHAGSTRAWQTDGNYTLPIDGDWVVIGVLAEKSQIRMTRSAARRKGSDEEDNEDPARALLNQDDDEDKQDATQDYRPHQSRKYMAWKLVDYGNASSAPGGDSRTRGTDSGDCVLSLQLFAADEQPDAPKEDESRNHVRAEIRPVLRKQPTKLYRGGSRGAFEQYWKEREGTVVAIINPRIMRRGTVNAANYNKNLLSITPVSAASIHVIGRAQDHAQCQAHKKDGSRCQAWVDARSGTGVCDFHLEQGVNAARRGRQEFAVGTSGGSWKSQKYAAATNDGDDIFTLGEGKGGRGRWKGNNRDNGASQPQKWDQSVEQGMSAGFASSGSFTRKGAFVVEGSGTWIERGGKIQADGRGPEVGDVNFDISEQYGRQKEEKKERMRLQAETDRLENELKQKAASYTPRPPPEAIGRGADDDGEADWMLQGTSTASQALREAKRVLNFKQELAEAATQAAQQGKQSRKSRLFSKNEDVLLAAALTKNAKERYRADDGAAPAKRPRWAYSAEAIQKMGFDPLAGAPGRSGAVPIWKANEDVEQASKNKLLARVSGPTTSLPPPMIRKNAKKSPAGSEARPMHTSRTSVPSKPVPKPAALAAPFSRASNTTSTKAGTGTSAAKQKRSKAVDSGSELDWGASADEDDDANEAPLPSGKQASSFGRGFFSDDDDDDDDGGDDIAWDELERKAVQEVAARRARPQMALAATARSAKRSSSDSELEFE